MKSRMEKYYDNHNFTESRVSKNENLYKQVNAVDVKSYNPNNNVKVIGDNDNVIDVDKIRNLLEKNYKEVPKRKPLVVEEDEDIDINLEETKEYNINSVLEKAREDKIIDYNKERLKKVHDTQFDILKSLNLEEEKEEPKKEEDPKEKELMSLINTITSKELEKTSNMDPLDILSDLKGSDDTKVLSGIEEEIKKEETKQMIKDETSKLKNSFYTTTNAFKQSDFDEFNDLKNDMQGTKIIIKILIAVVSLIFVIGLLIVLNNHFNFF